MNKENEVRFIPCGDSMEKMEEIKDDKLRDVSGGTADFSPKTCPKCGGLMIAHARFVNGVPQLAFYACSNCGHKE